MKYDTSSAFVEKVKNSLLKVSIRPGQPFDCLHTKLVMGVEFHEKKVVVATTGHVRAKRYGGKVIGLTVVRPIFSFELSQSARPLPAPKSVTSFMDNP